MKATLAQNSFTTGEIAPRAYGRKDMERYLQGLKYARNGHPVIHGGFKRRAGTLLVNESFSTEDNASILVPFVEGQGRAWMLEFLDEAIKIYDTDLSYTGIEVASPYTETQLSQLDWAQSDSTLWLAHPEVMPHRLQRLGEGVWVMAEAPFTTLPFDQVGHWPAATLTLSAVTVGVGRTATAGASVFLPSDVGRGIINVSGIGVITGYTSGTQVTIEITRAFPALVVASGAWQLESSPMAYVYPTPAKPAGVSCELYAGEARAASLTLSDITGSITINASASVFTAGDTGKKLFAGAGMATVTYVSATQVTAVVVNDFDTKEYATSQWAMPGTAWRAGDVGSMVRINGGLVRIDSVTSSALARGTVLRELAGAVLAPPLSWSLEATVWTAAFGYPRTVTIHQQRSIFAGSTKYPRTVWGSRIGELLDFERWTDDSDSFAWTIDGDEATAIRYVTSTKQLAVLTESAEYSLRSGIEKPLTPTNVRVVCESNHGTAQVRPAQINQEQVFVQAAGRKVRAFGYRYDLDEYRSPDISALAEHITKSGITWLTYAQEREQLLFATRADGKFLTCTVDRDQTPTVIGWALHETQGFVECVQSIPGPDRTQVWAIVRRTINGDQRRYIEVFDDAFEPLHASTPLPDDMEDRPVYGCTVDCGLVIEAANGMTEINVPHLGGKKVAVVADGSVIWDGYSNDSPTVPVSGVVALPRSAKRALVGLAFKTRCTLLTPEMQTAAGSAQGKAARTGEMVLNFLDTIGAKVQNNAGNSEVVPFRKFGAGVLDEMPIPFTGGKKVNLLGWERDESEITIWQEQPLPLHLLSAVRMHSVGGA